MELNGLHHISAITGDARANVDFYTRVLGLRMNAKTVNQDDPTVYHLFYGDEDAQPGHDLTFFEYPGAAPGRAGDGMVHTIVWRVASAEAIAFWAARLASEDVATTPGDHGALRFADREGLQHELVVSCASDAPLRAVHPEVPAEHALLGFEGVRAYASRPELSGVLLERLLGARPLGGDVWELRAHDRGSWIAYEPPLAEAGRPSAGTVHHIAWGTRASEHQAWLDLLNAASVPNSGRIDRHYFHAIYFREPSGVLFELADDAPGFTVDGPRELLGTSLILPPWLESRREELESRLTPLPAMAPRPAVAG